MRASIVSCQPAGHGHYKVVVEKPNYGRNLRQSSVTRWTHTTTDMPTIDAYKSDDEEASRDAESHLLWMVTTYGNKEIVKS